MVFPEAAMEFYSGVFVKFPGKKKRRIAFQLLKNCVQKVWKRKFFPKRQKWKSKWTMPTYKHTFCRPCRREWNERTKSYPQKYGNRWTKHNGNWWIVKYVLICYDNQFTVLSPLLFLLWTEDWELKTISFFHLMSCILLSGV